MKRIYRDNKQMVEQIVKQDLFKNSLLQAIFNNNNANAWDSFVPTDAEQKALRNILTSESGIRIQDLQADEDAQGYLDHGRNNWGITDAAALIYFADLFNQGGKGAGDRCAEIFVNNGNPQSLKELREIALKDEIMGKYINRRNTTYNEIIKLGYSAEGSGLKVK